MTALVVYNVDMDKLQTQTKLNRGNVRMVGIPADLHAKIKEIAEHDGIAIYEVVDRAIDRYERWSMITTALANVNGADDATV